MRWILVISFLISGWAFADDSNREDFPHLISYDRLMQLSPLDRAEYVSAIGKAIAKLESASYKQGVQAGDEAALERIQEQLAIFAGVWPTAYADDIEVPETSNLSTEKRAEIRSDALKCKGTYKDKKVINQARDEYIKGLVANNVRGSQQCMVGGIMRPYANESLKGSTRSMRCLPDKCRRAPHNRHLARCNPALFCNESGDEICASLSQSVAQSCWEQTEKARASAQKKNQPFACKKSLETKEQWASADEGMREFCQRPGAKVLFCFECLELRATIADNFAKFASTAQPTPLNSSPRTNQ